MVSVKTNTTPGGMRNNFESSAAHLLPYDPVAKKRAAGSKRGESLISEVDGEVQVAASIGKPGIGKTGVHLRNYKYDEYKKLSQAQKDELNEYKKKHAHLFQKPDQQKKKQKNFNQSHSTRRNCPALFLSRCNPQLAKPTNKRMKRRLQMKLKRTLCL